MNASPRLMLAEGIHLNVPETTYHQDPCITPSASSGVLRAIIDQSPMHAHAIHPQLGGTYSEDGTEAQNTGTILHSMILGTPAPYVVLHVDSFRTNDAKAMRAAAIAEGMIPLKVADLARMQDTAASIRARLQAMPDVWNAMQDAVSNRMTEVTLIWRERGVLCRCRYDTLPAAAFGASYDLKFTGKSADPAAFGKTLVNNYRIQGDLYPRGVKALRGDRPDFVFVAAETEEPFGVSLHAMDSDLAALAYDDTDEALATWASCLEADRWPGYAPHVHRHNAPIWMLKAREERWLRDGYPSSPAHKDAA